MDAASATSAAVAGAAGIVATFADGANATSAAAAASTAAAAADAASSAAAANNSMAAMLDAGIANQAVQCNCTLFQVCCFSQRVSNEGTRVGLRQQGMRLADEKLLSYSERL